MNNRVVLSILGALAAALAVIGATPAVTWHTGVAAAIAALAALGVPTVHSALNGTTPATPLPAEADPNSDELATLPLQAPGAGGTETPTGGAV